MAKRYLKENSASSITDEQVRKLQDERKHALSNISDKGDAGHQIIAAARERERNLSRVEHHMETVCSQAKLLDDQLDDVCAGKKKKKKKGWFKRKKKRKVDGDDGNGEGGDAANHVEHARGDQAARQAALRSAETSGLMGPPSPTGGQYSDIASAPSPTAGHYSDISSAPSAAPIAPSPGSLTAYLDVRPSTKAESPYGASGATRRRATGAAAAPVHDMYNESPTPMPTCDTAGHAEVVVQQGRETPFATYGNNERTGLLSAAEIGLEDDDDSCCTIA